MNKQMELRVLIDAREQTPLDFDGCNEVKGIEVVKLETGDYTIKDIESILCIERKQSCAEFCSNVSQPRFVKQLERMNKIPESHIVLMFSVQQLLDYPLKSNLPDSIKKKIRLNGKFVLSQILIWQRRYPNIQWHFAGNPSAGKELVIYLMKESYRYNVMYKPK